ncbi:hypothetical protein C2G38_2064402 [Gigaspora rosea]|uniref:Uncharacterized protein n=1 Tax=Gigaspora rosea TaxID=44941 RepID=A0A397W2Z9_9GLOM|nr:hypothetical protein C2G38_2064402 [Gigaspora rosea]
MTSPIKSLRRKYAFTCVDFRIVNYNNTAHIALLIYVIYDVCVLYWFEHSNFIVYEERMAISYDLLGYIIFILASQIIQIYDFRICSCYTIRVFLTPLELLENVFNRSSMIVFQMNKVWATCLIHQRCPVSLYRSLYFLIYNKE